MGVKHYKNKFTEEELNRLLDICKKSTDVVSWYHHAKEIRGPFFRWFTCSDASNEHKKDVSNTQEDCEFGAHAMNNFELLLLEVKTLKNIKISNDRLFESSVVTSEVDYSSRVSENKKLKECVEFIYRNNYAGASFVAGKCLEEIKEL